MKFSSALFLLLCLTSVPVVTGAQNDPTMLPISSAGPDDDVRAVTDIIDNLFTATDARDWDRVTALFADSVQMDYSALGAKPATQSPGETVDGWRTLLPGFERTVHNPHNLAVWVAGDRATATYDALATHYLDGQQWTVFAGYDSEFIRQDGQWKIARTRLSLYEQSGDASLPQQAMERASSTMDTIAFTSPHTDRVRAFFTYLEAGDLDAFLATFASDGKQLMPLAPEGFPETREGHEALRERYTPVADFASQQYTVAVIPTADPNTVLAKYTGRITVSEGEEYNNSYVGIFQFNDDGLIETFTEFFLPPAFDTSQTYPAVVVTGSWTSVKEQMPDEYASLLAKDGFITLTFDFRGFGQSEGSPRQFEDGERKITDIRNAVTWLLTHDNVNGDLTGLGVCASSGYMAHAVARDDRFDRLALVAPWLHNPAMTEELYGSRPGGRQALLDLAEEARIAYDQNGTVVYDQAVSELNELAAMYVPDGAFPYYLNPAAGAGPVYENRWAVMSWAPWLTFDAISVAADIDVPVHIVHSESGAVPQGAKEFIDILPTRPEVVWLNDYNQLQLYYMPEAVDAAMERTSAWLREQAR
ncbi:nuclear transport factor 2 family protein [Neolewinella sp.]|uniref:nuclear transport factor 2 family protein n=1 Tax=Neolewinella sp. TaxID=2993543 RepID=UPI003B515840